MGLFSRKKKETRNLDQKTADFIKGVDLDTGQQNNSGVEVNEESSLKISAVYACVKVIAETIASSFIVAPLFGIDMQGIEIETPNNYYEAISSMSN